jgi:hypothetical protein
MTYNIMHPKTDKLQWIVNPDAGRITPFMPDTDQKLLAIQTDNRKDFDAHLQQFRDIGWKKVDSQ